MRTACLLTVSQHALHRGGGVSQNALCRGVCIPACTRGCTWWGGVPAGGVPAQGGCKSLGAYLPRGVPVWGVSLHAMGQTHLMWTDRHLWKHNLCKLRLRAVNILSTNTSGNVPSVRYVIPLVTYTIFEMLSQFYWIQRKSFRDQIGHYAEWLLLTLSALNSFVKCANFQVP